MRDLDSRDKRAAENGSEGVGAARTTRGAPGRSVRAESGNQGASVQRKAASAGSPDAPTERRSAASWTQDPYMDAAHRGTPGAGAVIQRQEAAPAESAGAGESEAAPENPHEAVIAAGEQALAAGMKVWSYFPLSADDPAQVMFMFRSDDLQALLQYLVTEWAYASDFMAQMGARDDGQPRWVETLRARALYVPTGDVKPDEQRLITVSGQLCDLIAEKTASDEFRERVARRADSARNKKAITDKEFQNGRDLMSGFTSCNSFIGKPLGGEVSMADGKGPSFMNEVETQGKGGFPPGSFIHTNDTISGTRPRPGDMIVFRKEAQKVVDGETLSQFQHIAVFRSLAPGPEPGKEIWTTVDGGNETTQSTGAGLALEKELTVDLATAVAKGRYKTRHIYGWIDVQKLYESQHPEDEAEESAE